MCKVVLAKAELGFLRPLRKRVPEIELSSSRSLLHNCRRFVGWEMHLKEGNRLIGVIDEVVDVENPLGSESYFKVVGEDNGHLIPVVDEWVTSFRPDLRQLILSPPDGLLEIGEVEGRIERLKERLLPFVTRDPSRLKEQFAMPTLSMLMEASRKDLVEEIEDLGGLFYVASILGWKAKRKPPGYWDDIEMVDREIDIFIASDWIVEKGIDGKFYYNPALNRIQWVEPNLGDPNDTYPSCEPDQRAMPPMQSLMDGDRWDLHHAIKSHGGYRQVAKCLNRPLSPRVFRKLQNIVHALDTIHHFVILYKLKTIPYMTTLRKLNEERLQDAIRLVGGPRAAAKYLNMEFDYVPQPHKRRRGTSTNRWRNVDTAASRLIQFAVDNELTDSEGSIRVPTQKELIKADRHDLKYALCKFGKKEIAARLDKHLL